MKVKAIVMEDFINYKLPSMFINTCFCDWKCCKDVGMGPEMCQNESLFKLENIEVDNQLIYKQFVDNPITKAVVIGGLEPMIQINEIIDLINLFRTKNENCPFIIYTGYYPEEIPKPINELKKYNNIIIKFGRFIPNKPDKYDSVLGITLASDNQYAEKIS